MAETVYLDNASTTFPKPENVYAVIDGFYRSHGVSPGRSGSDLGREAGALVDATRDALADLFRLPGDDTNRVCFAANATDALNLALHGICRAGDHVVASVLDHNSVLRPLHALRNEGITHDLAPSDGAGYVDPDAIAALIRPETRLVVLNHASNVFGTLQDAAAVGRLCRERGVLFLLDAAQTAGCVPIDMAAWHVDVLAFTGHKSLLGPTGTGGLAVGPDVPIRTTRWGGTGVRSAEIEHPPEFPYRLEAGTPNLAGIAGLHAGIGWIAEETIEVIRRRELALAGRLLEGLRALDGVRTPWAGADARHVGVVSCTLDGMDPEEIGQRLDVDHGVLTRTGLQCAPLAHEAAGTAPRGTVRFGIGPLNTERHIDVALKGMADLAADARKRRRA